MVNQNAGNQNAGTQGRVMRVMMGKKRSEFLVVPSPARDK